MRWKWWKRCVSATRQLSALMIQRLMGDCFVLTQFVFLLVESLNTDPTRSRGANRGTMTLRLGVFGPHHLMRCGLMTTGSMVLPRRT